mmetsp:Transcript_24550/g.48165  ORF Transcript_24550/g.48165 Transcript_24550/m.48165 type:complete len:85 (-) Transcript_24550:542-796(-)
MTDRDEFQSWTLCHSIPHSLTLSVSINRSVSEALFLRPQVPPEIEPRQPTVEAPTAKEKNIDRSTDQHTWPKFSPTFLATAELK